MNVNYIVGERQSGTSGVSRYRSTIYELLKDKVDFNTIEFKPCPLFAPIQRYFIFPRMVRRKMMNGVTHVTGQPQAHVLNVIDPKNSVVTVFDIFNLRILKNYAFRSELQRNQGMASYLLFKLETQMWTNALIKAKKVIAISEFTKKEIVANLDYPPEQIEVTLLGVDSKKFKPLSEFKKPDCFDGKTVLHIGGTELRENTTIILQAFHLLKAKLPGVKMIKIGRCGKEFRKLMALLNLTNDITFINRVSEKELPLFYNSADLLFFPSVYEGFGLPPLEAMACGTPVVTSNAASLPEVVGNAGIMKTHNDFDGFANAMYEILTDDGLRKDLVCRGIDRAERFKWEKTASETLRIYEGVGS